MVYINFLFPKIFALIDKNINKTFKIQAVFVYSSSAILIISNIFVSKKCLSLILVSLLNKFKSDETKSFIDSH